MNKTRTIILNTILAMLVLSGAAAAVQADESKENQAKELQLFKQAKISLIDAIKAAEQKTGGNALEAEIDDESNTVRFEVEVLKDGQIHEVMVDGKTGEVLQVALDDEADDRAENDKD